jgi:hypothetical protein
MLTIGEKMNIVWESKSLFAASNPTVEIYLDQANITGNISKYKVDNAFGTQYNWSLGTVRIECSFASTNCTKVVSPGEYVLRIVNAETKEETKSKPFILLANNISPESFSKPEVSYINNTSLDPITTVLASGLEVEVGKLSIINPNNFEIKVTNIWFDPSNISQVNIDNRRADLLLDITVPPKQAVLLPVSIIPKCSNPQETKCRSQVSFTRVTTHTSNGFKDVQINQSTISWSVGFNPLQPGVSNESLNIEANGQTDNIIVDNGSIVNLTWNTKGIIDNTCSIAAPDSGTLFYSGGLTNNASGINSFPIVKESYFFLNCVKKFDSKPISKYIIVKPRAAAANLPTFFKFDFAKTQQSEITVSSGTQVTLTWDAPNHINGTCSVAGPDSGTSLYTGGSNNMLVTPILTKPVTAKSYFFLQCVNSKYNHCYALYKKTSANCFLWTFVGTCCLFCRTTGLLA